MNLEVLLRQKGEKEGHFKQWEQHGQSAEGNLWSWGYTGGPDTREQLMFTWKNYLEKVEK